MWLKEPRRWQDRESGSTCSRQLGPRVAPAGGEPPGGRQRAAPSEGTFPLYHVQGCRRRVIEYVGGSMVPLFSGRSAHGSLRERLVPCLGQQQEQQRPTAGEHGAH